MRTSTKGIKLIKSYEGLHDGDKKLSGLQPQMDPIGIWTEGYGRAMRDSKGNFIRGAANKQKAYDNITIRTEFQAEQALACDLGPREETVAKKIRVPLTQGQFDALVSHTYNTGGSGTLFDLVNRKAPLSQIKTWFETKYITAGGVKLAGLVRRRKEEFQLYIS